MQCPPRPGPGKKGMKPNGFVLAALITSHTSTSSRSQMIASSLASAMFTARNVFSSSFTISAALALLTATTWSTAWLYSRTARSVQRGVTPPTTFGVLRVLNFLFAGSTRSGENARKKSRPTCNPDSDSLGRSSSSVVPG